MNNYIRVLLIFILAVYGCAAANPKDTKKVPEPEPDSTEVKSVREEVPLFRQYMEKGKKSAAETNYDEALIYFLKANEEKPDDENILLETGVTLRHLNRREEALEYFYQAAGKNPKSLKALRNIGTVHMELGHDPEAIEAFTGLLDIEPNDEASIVNLADLYFRAGDYESCHKYIRMFYQNLGDYNFLNTTADEYKRIKSIFERFTDYMTVIEREKRKKQNKVKYAY